MKRKTEAELKNLDRARELLNEAATLLLGAAEPTKAALASSLAREVKNIRTREEVVSIYACV